VGQHPLPGSRRFNNPRARQVSTTKGTGGDIIILEEAAYIDPNFAYETVFPLLIVGTTSLLAISTVTSEINFFTRLLRMRDKVTDLPMFTTLSVTLACAKCREDGRAADCPHMLHLVPRWQSGDRHIKLKTVMQDRPDLIESELSGLAFDSLQQVFRGADLDIMFSQAPPPPIINELVHLFIDPAAGGPGSDYAVLSVCRQKGLITVTLLPHHVVAQAQPRLQARPQRLVGPERGDQLRLPPPEGQRRGRRPAQRDRRHDVGEHPLSLPVLYIAATPPGRPP